MRKKNYLFLFVAFLILQSCFTEGDSPRKANGPVQYGHTIRFNEISAPRSLHPPSIGSVTAQAISNQLFQGLFRPDPKDLSPQPCLAKSWQLSKDQKTYTFELRDDVRFHDSPCFPQSIGRNLTAWDVKYCFDRLCLDKDWNRGQWVFVNKVAGAQDFFKQANDAQYQSEGVSGIKVLNDHLLEIELVEPHSDFIHLLGIVFTAIYPHEAVSHFSEQDLHTHPVGTGPFMVEAHLKANTTILKANPTYWEHDEYENQLPYLDKIKIHYFNDRRREFLEFKKGNLDFVGSVPVEITEDIQNSQNIRHANFIKQSAGAMSCQFYGFMNENSVFSDLRVRQAFNLAIDREKIVKFIVKEGVAGTKGVVPPCFKLHHQREIKGWTYQPQKARELLAKAGFPEGKGFPRILLQTNTAGASGKNKRVAEAVCDMLGQTLNVDVRSQVLTWKNHREKIEKGEALFWRSSWLADYPSPLSFLHLWYGPNAKDIDHFSYHNTERYYSKAFDSLISHGVKDLDPDIRAEFLRQADEMIIRDAVIMPIYYDDNYRLIRPAVKNFPLNAMDYRDFTRVYINEKSTNE